HCCCGTLRRAAASAEFGVGNVERRAVRAYFVGTNEDVIFDGDLFLVRWIIAPLWILLRAADRAEFVRLTEQFWGAAVLAVPEHLIDAFNGNGLPILTPNFVRVGILVFVRKIKRRQRHGR